jgi:glycosyltransferase involved in cell wall biosynthesis
MKALMISSDRNILSAGSAVAARMAEYGSLVEELHIIVLSDASHGLLPGKIGENVWAYPTNSMASFLRPLGAARMGKRLVYEKGFVRGKSLVTADSIECGWAGMKIKKKWRLPLEVQLHSDPFSPYFSGFQNAVRKFFSRRVLNSADAIRCVSREVADRLGESQALKPKVYVLPISVNRERAESGAVRFDAHARYGWRFVLLVVARLSPEKDLGTALKALARVRSKYPDTGIVFVGSGPEEKKLKSLARDLGLAANAEFAGWQTDIASFYKTSNAFIQTSLFEGYGLALVEAGLNGLPAVTTPVGIAAELENGKNAYLCEPGDADCFAASIVDLIENNFKREAFALNMKKTLESKLISNGEFLKQLGEKWASVAILAR